MKAFVSGMGLGMAAGAAAGLLCGSSLSRAQQRQVRQAASGAVRTLEDEARRLRRRFPG